MTIEMTFPEIDGTIKEAFVVKWLKSAGEEVCVAEPLLEVTTDKANVEIPSTVAGILVAQHVAEEQRVRVGDLLATFKQSRPEEGR